MEIAKPNKVGRVEDMMPNDFTLHSIDLGEGRHDTKWAYGDQVMR